jgi:NAD(P)-dependent dehydrogenase (short-subunit alcohol dehydrogenase family)
MPALSQFSLEGRVVAVTGAGRGIGRAIALLAAESGALISACSRTTTELMDLQSEIEGHGGRCQVSTVDMTDNADLAEFIDRTIQAYGRVDCFVNNAGTNFMMPAVDYTSADIDLLYNINLKAVYLASAAIAKYFIAAGVAGSIVNITSQAGVVGAPGRAPYSAMKAGVNNLTRTLAAEWASSGIRVNAVAPTVTSTPLTDEGFKRSPEFAAEVNERILLGHRPAKMHDIALPVLFLLSPSAAMITGHVLVVDGGWTIV